MMSKYRSGDTDLGRIIEQMDARIRALESENRASFTSVDSNAFVTREGSFRVLDAAGNVVGELGKMANGEYGLAFKDGSGNSIVKLGKSIVDDLYSLRILDNTGAIMVRAGEIKKTGEPGAEIIDYGLAAVNPSGQLVKLSQLAFGLNAASDSGSGTRSTTLPVGFADLTGANVGPAVEVTIGDTGKALCFFSADIEFDPSLASFMHGNASVEVSGASTVAASTSYAVSRRVSRVGADTVHILDAIQSASMHLFSGLTPGLNTFTMKYRADATLQNLTITFKEREIAVFPY